MTDEIECPECEHRFEDDGSGDVAVCEDCNASFIRHTHVVGDDNETCYVCGERAEGVYAGTSDGGVVEVALCTEHSPDSPPIRWLDGGTEAVSQ